MTELNKHHTVTEDTPDNILLGAGIFVGGLTWASNKWTYEKTFGATNGGGKVEFKPETMDAEVDGVTVKTRGLTFKTGETAKISTNLAEVTGDNLLIASMGKKVADTTVTGYEEITSKPNIEKGDYIENLGFIGFLANGDPAVIKFDYALCTSGLSFETKKKEQATIPVEFECYADLKADDLTVLPWHIFTKKVASV